MMFLQICNNVVVIDWCKSFISAQYMENVLAECDHIFYAD